MAGVYIHIPFCRKRCNYCDFYKTLDTGLTESYIEALIKEIDLRSDYLGDEKVDTLYFGGGTPSVLDYTKIRQLIEKLRGSFSFTSDPEITLEVNPDDTSRQFYLSMLKQGFNRLSIGVQSLDNEILKLLNRRHDADQARKSVKDAMGAGFKNISVDLIYGIPGMSNNLWQNTLVETFKMGITHLSAYHLTIEKGTMFGRMMDAGELIEIDEQESENQFNTLVNLSRNNGFVQYEISNLCRERYYSRHNTNYWKQVSYIGLGPSAHSYNGYSRQWNVSDLNYYIKSLGRGTVPFESEILDSRMRFNEYIMTSLRTMWGVDLGFVENEFNKESHDYLVNVASRFIRYGMLLIDESNNLVLTDQGKMISDNIISELMMGQDSTLA